MLETIKRRKRYSHRRKITHTDARIGSIVGGGICDSSICPSRTSGVSKKYKSQRGKYTLRPHKITSARYDEYGNLIGGGIFDYFKLKMNVRKIKGIIGKLNVLERGIKKEIDSYAVQADQFKSMAEKTADYQTKYILAKRKNVILKNFRKDTDAINQKTDKNVIATIDSEIKRSDGDYKHAEKMVDAQYKEVGKDIKNFLYLSDKYQKELKKFGQIDELRKKVEIYQNEISHIRDKALAAEGRSDLGKSEKAAIAKYRANKTDYDYVVSLTDQNLQTVRELEQKSSELTIKMEFYKNQFGMYKREGYESKGAQGKVKAGAELKKWAELTDKLAASLIGVGKKSADIIDILTDIDKSITKCTTELVTVPEYYNKQANANAILWFGKDVKDMIKVMSEVKKHFNAMKNEFYNQISAENMYPNYNYNSVFLRVIEIRLKFYHWMVDTAISRDAKSSIKTVSGGYYSLIGGSQSGRPRGQSSRQSQVPRTKDNICEYIKTNYLSFANMNINRLAKNLMGIKKNKINNKANECYNISKEEFKICVRNLFERYLLAAYITDDIITNGLDTVLQNDIKIFNDVMLELDNNTTWNDTVKNEVAKKFDKLQSNFTFDTAIASISNNKQSDKKITELFDNNGNKLTRGNFTQEETNLQDYITSGGKAYMKDFIGKLVSNSKKFYGVLDFEKEKGQIAISTLVSNLPLTSSLSSTVSTTSTTATSSSTNTINTSGSVNPAIKYDKTLNSDKLEEIKDDINYIKGRLTNYGYYPSDDLKHIVSVLDEIGSSLDAVFVSLEEQTQIKGLDKIKEYAAEIRYKVENDKFDINIDEEDDLNNILEINDLENLNGDYKIMKPFYDDIKSTTGDKSKAKAALKELIKEYTQDIKSKESIGKISLRLRDKPEYRKSAAPSPSSSTGSPSAVAPLTPSAPIAALAAPATALAPVPATTTGSSGSASQQQPSKSTNTKTNTTEEKPPRWLEELDTVSKKNKDYISNILIRIPKESYPKQYNEVKKEFESVRDKINGLQGPGMLLAQLSDDFQDMTTTLIDLKSIEADLIDVKVKTQPRLALGLGPYIPEPLSLEKKSQAMDDTKKISEMVKGMMQNTFFEDRGDKEKAKDDASKLFDRIITRLSKERPPEISYEDATILRKPDALDSFLVKLTKAVDSAGITSAIAAGQTGASNEIKDSQIKFCRLVNKLKEIVTDNIENAKIRQIESKIGDCSYNGTILKQNKGGKKGQQGQYKKDE